MADEQNRYFDPFGELISSFWAILPEQAADDVAKFKKDVLIGIKSVVDSVIDTEINLMERHVEMAREMRARWDREEAAYDAPPADPTIDPTPNPS